MKITIDLDEELIETYTGYAEKFKCTVSDVIGNVLIARVVEYLVRAEVYGDPIKGYMPELMLNDGVLARTGEEVADVVREATLLELESVQQIKNVIELMGLKADQGEHGNA